MGKKRSHKFVPYGTQGNGPNKQVQKKPPAPVEESESSDESLILDRPASMASSDSEPEAPINRKPTVRLVIKQVYKNPADAAHRYPPPLEAESDVVSCKAHTDDIDYEFSFVEIKKKEKRHLQEWAQPVHGYRRGPPLFHRREDHSRPSVSCNGTSSAPRREDYPGPPASFYEATDHRMNGSIVKMETEMKRETESEQSRPFEPKVQVKEEWKLEDLDQKLPHTSLPAETDWDVTSVISSDAWNNAEISFNEL